MTQMESLQGKFLLATPRMPDPRFREMVIYMCAHNDEGAMGLVVNQPTSYSLADIFLAAEVEPPLGKLPPVYIGGPVEMTAPFFLFSSDYQPENFLAVNDTVRLSGDASIIFDIAAGHGPKDFIFLLGYTGWAAGQLESELAVNGWLTLPADYEDIFHTPDEVKWRRVAERYGINITLYDDSIGNA